MTAKYKPVVLVIDDDAPLRKTLCEILSGNGLRVIEAGDGRHGLAMIDEHGPPDLIITDILMPDKEGIETIRDVRLKHPSVKIIAISGGGRYGQKDALRAAQAMGADAVLAKPFEFEELEETVREVLKIA